MLSQLVFAAVLASLWSDSSVSALDLAPGESCLTPGGNQGRCTLVSHCSFVKELWKNVTMRGNVNRRADHDYVMSFRCGKEPGSGKPLVCCPEVGSVDGCGQLSLSDVIFGGEETDLDEFPWVAAIVFRKDRIQKIFCGGSLINERYVLTAAHCFGNKRWTLDSVRLGEWDVDTSPDCKTDSSGKLQCNGLHQDFKVSKVIIHEGYSNGDRKKENDIAILKLQKQVTFSKSIAPICIPTREMADSLTIHTTRFDVTGWGSTENGTQSARKMKVTVPGRSMAECTKAFRVAPSFFVDSQLCVGGEKGKDSCKGDSGGPLMAVVRNRWQLVGIVSFGSIYCGSEKVPAIYTRVGSYLNWVAGKLELEGREFR